MSIKTYFISTFVFGALLLTIGCGTSTSTSSLPESSAAEFQQQLDQPGLVLAKFGAPWCGPCCEVDRELGKLAAQAEGQAEIITINVDNEPELAQKFNIRSIPRIMLFQNGNKVKDHTGFVKSDVMQSWIRAAGQPATDS